MELRTACSPKDAKYYDTQRLRDELLIQDLFNDDNIKYVYSHIDRIITGGAKPVEKKLVMEAGAELRADGEKCHHALKTSRGQYGSDSQRLQQPRNVLR